MPHLRLFPHLRTLLLEAYVRTLVFQQLALSQFLHVFVLCFGARCVTQGRLMHIFDFAAPYFIAMTSFNISEPADGWRPLQTVMVVMPTVNKWHLLFLGHSAFPATSLFRKRSTCVWIRVQHNCSFFFNSYLLVGWWQNSIFQDGWHLHLSLSYSWLEFSNFVRMK